MMWLLDDLPGRIEQLERLHSPIEQALKSITETCEADEPSDEYYAEVTLGYEIEEIEQLLGVAFVCAQTVLTVVRARIVDISKICEREFGKKLSLCPDTKGKALFKRAPDWKVNCGFTEVEAINAVANYWKHVDEWTFDFPERDGEVEVIWQGNANKETVRIVNAIGMQPFSTGNIRAAAEALGIENVSDLSPLRASVERWAKDITLTAKAEVRLIP